VQISGNKVKLRLLDNSDWELFKILNTCPVIMEYVYEPFTIEETLERFKVRTQPWNDKSDQWLCFAIDEINSETKLGSIGLKITKSSSENCGSGLFIENRSTE